MRGFIRLLLGAGLIAGLWILLRELLEDQSGADASEDQHREATGRPEPTGASTASSNGADSLSKADLYREAQKLDVEGRSKMTKDQLAEAVAAARRASSS